MINKNFNGFIGNDKENLKNLIKQTYSIEAEKIINAANNFLNGIIKFDMKWDMERCDREYIFNDKIDWLIVPFQDPEWAYMLNRHKHFVIYGQAYLISDNKKYLKKFIKEIIDWIDNVTLKKDEILLAWRSIETGLRLRNWTKALEYFKDDLDEEVLGKIVLSMTMQIEYIISKSKNDRFLSNWVILENHGLFIATEFLKKYKFGKEARESSLKYMSKAVEMQILDDGMHWEQSYMYHNEMINCILSAMLIAQRNNIKFPSILKEKVEKMLYGTLSIMQPNYMQTNYGDSDIEDLRDILGFGAIMLKDSKLKNFVNKLPIDVLFDVGFEGYKIFECIKGESPEFTSIALNDCGNYILRNKWGEDGIFTLFKCGFLGSGHGHFDLLHFNINYKGQDILVDSGRYNYAENNEFRVMLKEAKSHNTFILNNMEFNKSNGSWGTLKVSEAVKRESKFSKLASFVEGGHLGYMYNGAFVNRKVIFLNKGIWFISDEIRSNSVQEYKAFFNFNSKNVKINKNSLEYKVNLIDEKENVFTVIALDNQIIKLEKSYISSEYNKIRESKKAIFKKDFSSDIDLNYLMYMDDIGVLKNQEYIPIIDWSGKELDNKYSKALKIEFENEIYIIVKVFKEEPRGRKTYTVDGVQIYGRVVVIQKNNNQTKIEVLSY